MNVDFVTAIKLYFANYINFKGRSTRAEYWWATLFVFLVGIVCSFFGWKWLESIATLVFFLPNLAILTRRFHDIGRSGWWIVGIYAFVILVCGYGFSSVVMAAYTGSASAVEAAVHSNYSSIAFSGIASLIIAVWMIIWLCKPSAPDNEYGPNPYGEQ